VTHVLDFDVSNRVKNIRIAIAATLLQYKLAVLKKSIHHGYCIPPTSRQHHWYSSPSSSFDVTEN
jgi:hypothetical protein